MEKLIKSYKSVTLLIEYLLTDFNNFYDRIVQDYDLIPLVAFLFQLTVLTILGNEILMPIENDSGDSNKFDMAWFTFGYIQLFMMACMFSVFFYGFMKLVSPNFDRRFRDILRFFVVYYIIMQSITLTYSFLSDLYLYVATDFFESMDNPFYDSGDIVEYKIIAFIENYILNPCLIILLGILLYVSVYRSIITVVCFLAYGLLYFFIIEPYIDGLWASFMCKRFDVLCWNI